MGRQITSRLSLNKETMRNLTEQNLIEVAGGAIAKAVKLQAKTRAAISDCEACETYRCENFARILPVPQVYISGASGTGF